jgi:DNA polymerase III delta prime subunit
VEIINQLWVEKYRPKKLSDIILPQKYRDDFERYVARRDLPNLLFYGPPGGGKSTIARIMSSPEGVLIHPKDNLLLLNGSSQSTRGIAFVDKVIEPFLKVPPIKDKFRVVFIDEADNLTPDSFLSLRSVIEKYQTDYGRFIFTCNYISKIPDPLQSRFTSYIFQTLPKDFIIKYTKNILENECIEYQEKELSYVIQNFYPDVRKIVNILHQNSWSKSSIADKKGKLFIDEDTIKSNEKIVIACILNIINLVGRQETNKVGSEVSTIIETLQKEDIEYRNLYTELFFTKNIPAYVKIVVNDYANKHQNCLIPSMHFIGMIFDIIKTLQEYIKAMKERT